MNQATLVIIKPDGLVKSLTGNILTRLSETKLEIAAAKLARVSKELARAHYADLKEKPFFEDLIRYIQGEFHERKKVLAMVYYGEDAIEKVKRLAGDVNPEDADPISIRGAYGRVTTRGFYENVMDVSEDEKDAERGIKLWFEPDEIVFDLYPIETKTIETIQEKIWKTHIKIQNVMTHPKGRTKSFKIITKEEWEFKYKDLINWLMEEEKIKKHKALVGRWVVEYSGNDDHLYKFFVKNWKNSPDESEVHTRAIALTGVENRAILQELKGIGTHEELELYLENYAKGLKREELTEFSHLSREEQIAKALRSAHTIYCPEEKKFIFINSSYYGQLKSKSTLGPLEEYLLEQIKIENGKITNKNEAWLSIHGGCVEYITSKNIKKGTVLIAPTGTGKSTQAYGLVEAKKENKLHSDDWVFVNLETLEVIISEDQFYMRTNIAEIFPHLIPLLVNEPLENVPFTDDITDLIESYRDPQQFSSAINNGQITKKAYDQLIDQMIEDSDARSMIDPRIMVGGDKFIETTILRKILLMKRDYDDTIIIKTQNPDEMIEILTSKDNVKNHKYGLKDPDGYGIPVKSTTEIYYNPYLCIVEVDREKNHYGPLDQERIIIYKELASHKDVNVAWVNTRLPASQTQFCIRVFLEEEANFIKIIKGYEMEGDLLVTLGLKKREKEKIPGIREIDRVGLYKNDQEVEVVALYKDWNLVDLIAFDKKGEGTGQVVSYSKGPIDKFYEKYKYVGAYELFSSKKPALTIHEITP